jgi:Protein of unknown function (DUF4232)
VTSDRTVLLVVAVAGAALAAGAHASSNDSIRTCTTSQLEIRLVHSGVAAGTVGGYIRFTNRATAPCRLSGWPILAAIAADGTSTIAVHDRSTMFGPRPTIKGIPVVRLRHGEKADAVFVTSDNPGPGATRCPPPYRHLRVTPPGNSRSVLVSAWLPAYAQYLPACTRIEVSMVVPASAVYHG